jgi:hypothetical protein
MKTLKVTLTAVALVASAWVVTTAAEALLSPRAAANAPRTAEGTNAASANHEGTHAMGCMGPSHGTDASAEAMAHCKTMKKDHAAKSCCH